MSIIKATCPSDVILIEENEVGTLLTEDGNYKKLFKQDINTIIVFNKHNRKYVVMGTPREVTFTSGADGLALNTIVIK
jgi:hypothetical protein